jgi:nitroreductase
MELKDAILYRRSTRAFKNIPVADEIIREMLAAAQAAPSGGNGQSHVFGIVYDESIKKDLAEAAGGQTWIASAPVVIACCARLEKDFKKLPDDDFGLEVNRLRFGESLMRYMMAYPDWSEMAVLLGDAVPLIPAEHIFLTAVAHGLSACFIGWLDVQKASRILNLPEDIRCLYLLPVGYPAESPEEKELKRIEEISFTNRYP